MNTSSGDSLQTYFEQQNDKEAASIVAAVIALLPSSWEQFVVEEEIEQKDNHHIYTADNVLNQQNILLTKESEIAALKEVILKWRYRALEAEERLKSIQLNHEKECKLMESRYTRKLYQQEDIITTLNEQVDYLITQQQIYRQQSDTESFASTIDYEEDEEYEDEDGESMMSSIYDRDVEQGLVTVQSRPTELKSETILDNIQDTMRAIEHELSFHTTSSTVDIIPNVRRHRRSPTYNSSSTYYSSATLIDSEASYKSTKKIKKSSFFINRIFKKAFPKLYTKKNNTTMKYSTSPALFIDSSIQFDGTQQQPVYPIQV